jgi:DNA-binding response OmpR family regulator
MHENRAAQSNEPADATRPSPGSSPYRILVVEDDSALRRFNAEALINCGYTVEVAEDGAVAWEAFQIGTYNLLVTDHSMPKVTGVELLKKLHGARMALPVIMATGTLPEAEFTRHPWLLPDAMLLKPYTIAELLETVEKVLCATNGTRLWIAPCPEFGRQPTADICQAG